MRQTRVDATNEVGESLRRYADRGVFRGFDSKRTRSGTFEYRFLWLTKEPFRIVYDPSKRRLLIKNLLSDVPATSPMYRELRSFVDRLSTTALPKHRRIDTKRLTVKCINRLGKVSICVEFGFRNGAYAVGKAVNLINELFHGFLNGPYYQYRVEHFGDPEE